MKTNNRNQDILIDATETLKKASLAMDNINHALGTGEDALLADLAMLDTLKEDVTYILGRLH